VEQQPDSLRPHLLDASALLKLVVAEPGAERLREYFETNVWFLTPLLCVAEALGVLKRQWAKKELSAERCFEAANLLLTHNREHGKIRVQLPGLEERDVFVAVQTMAQRHGIDLVDALQLHVLKETSLASYAGGSKALLITADQALTSAARAEGLLVWECVHEGQPPRGVA